jgi:hypothetical protein
MSNPILEMRKRVFLQEAWESEILHLKAADKSTCPICSSHPFGTPAAWLTELDSALQAKCPVCTIIYHAVLRTQHSEPDLSRIRVTRETVLDLLLVSPRNRHNLINASKKNSDVEVFTVKGQAECELNVVGVRGDTQTKRAERYLPVLKAWLEKCDENHPNCVAKESPLPTRVIDVGSCEDDPIKLYHTQGENAKYLALSHCWQ